MKRMYPQNFIATSPTDILDDHPVVDFSPDIDLILENNSPLNVILSGFQWITKIYYRRLRKS